MSICTEAYRLFLEWRKTPAAKAAYEKHLKGCQDCHPMIETPDLEWQYDDDAIAAAAVARGVA